eukprot:COSAG06_NODE_9647_length_1852_cov_1.118654_1_plen_179_part_10
MLSGIVLVVGCGLKVWKTFPAMHAVRCAFQPLRIVFTYAQITSQLGDVLNFQLPPVFGGVIDAIRPIMDVWGLLFQALGSAECFGLSGFSSRWWLRVVVMPAILCAVIALVYIVERFRTTASAALTHAKGHIFLAIFFWCVILPCVALSCVCTHLRSVCHLPAEICACVSSATRRYAR